MRNLHHCCYRALFQFVCWRNKLMQNVQFLHICDTSRLLLGGVGSSAVPCHAVCMSFERDAKLICTTLALFVERQLLICQHYYFLAWPVPRHQSSVAPTCGLLRTTVCCFLTASFWRAWSTAFLESMLYQVVVLQTVVRLLFQQIICLLQDRLLTPHNHSFLPAYIVT